jgi:hypothetical protein
LCPVPWRTAWLTPPHHHVLCEICGAFIDIPAAAVAPTITAAQAASGYHLNRSGLTLLGRCLACQDDHCRVGVAAPTPTTVTSRPRRKLIDHNQMS